MFRKYSVNLEGKRKLIKDLNTNGINLTCIKAWKNLLLYSLPRLKRGLWTELEERRVSWSKKNIVLICKFRLLKFWKIDGPTRAFHRFHSTHGGFSSKFPRFIRQEERYIWIQLIRNETGFSIFYKPPCIFLILKWFEKFPETFRIFEDWRSKPQQFFNGILILHYQIEFWKNNSPLSE